MKKISKILKKSIFILFIILIFVLILYSIIYKLLGWYDTEYIFKSKNITVISVSDELMMSIIKPKDIIILKKVKEQDLKVGDIVYFTENNSKKIAKIENIKIDSSDVYYFTTKGEENYYYNENIKIENIEGKFEKKLDKWISFFVHLAISNTFSVAMSVVLILLIIILQKNKIKSIKRKRKKENKKQEDIN